MGRVREGEGVSMVKGVKGFSQNHYQVYRNSYITSIPIDIVFPKLKLFGFPIF